MKKLLIISLFLFNAIYTYGQEKNATYSYREIIEIVEQGDTLLLKKVFEQVEIDKIKDPSDISLLFYACSTGNIAMVRFLIDAGYSPNVISEYGCPAHWAAEKGHIGVIDYLIENGFDARIEEASYWVDKYNSGDRSMPVILQEVIKGILEKGIDYKNDPMNQYTDPSDNLLLASLIYYEKGSPKRLAEKIISQGVNVNIQDKYGMSALALSVYFLDTAAVNLLVESGADVNMPIHREKGHDVDPPLNDNVTPLHLLLYVIKDKPVILENDLDRVLYIAEKLIASGSNLHVRRKSTQQSVLDVVKEINHKKLNKLFKKMS